MHLRSAREPGSVALRSSLRAAVVVMLYAVPLTVPWTVAGVHIAIGAASALVVLNGLLWREWTLARSAADSGFIAFAIASVLSVALALDATSDPVPLKKLLLIPLVHMAAGSLSHATRARTALRLFVMATSVTALIAGIAFLVSHAPDARLQATSHYMTFSGLLLLAVPMAATAALLGPGRVRVVYALATVVLVIALLLTYTRSAWIGVVAAAFAILARLRPRLLVVLPPAVLVAFLLMPSTFQDRVLVTFDPSYHSNAQRIEMWRAGFHMWRDRPWTGVGLGDLQPIYRQYAPPDVEAVFGHLHSIWVHLLATMGTLGVAAFVWLMIGFGRIVWRSGESCADREARALALGAWGSFWGFHAMGLFEWNFGDVEVTIALYFLIGVLQATVLAEASRSQATVK